MKLVQNKNILISSNYSFNNLFEHLSLKYNLFFKEEFLGSSYYKLDDKVKYSRRTLPCKRGIDDILSRYLGLFSKINKKIISKHKDNKISLIFMHSCNSTDNAIIKIGNSLNIPTCVLQNGIWPSSLEKSPYMYGWSSKHILCTSEFMKDCYIKFGVEKNKITMTGAPYFDLYKNFNFKRGGNVILVGNDLSLINCYTTGEAVPLYHSPPIKYENFFSIIDVARIMSNYLFVIKLKPHGCLPINVFSELPSNVVVSNSPWIDVMSNASIVLSSCSTTAAEAIFAGVPTIVPKLYLPFADYKGAAIEIDWTVDNLCNAIRLVSDNYEVDNTEFNKYYFSHNLDYNSTSRVLAEVDRIVEQN